MEGYVKAPHDIIRDPSLSPAAKVAWLLIAGMPPGYHPTREQWMEMLPCKDKATWWKVIEELKAAGLIEVTVSGTRRFFNVAGKGEKTDPSTVEKTNHRRVEKPTIEGWVFPPIKKNIEEQKKNNCGARARMREEIMQDMMVETGCRSCGITREQYLRMADEIFSDWEFTCQPEADWNKHHFLSVLRIKTRELKRNGIHQQKRKPTVTGPVSGRTQEENPLAGYPTYGKTGD